MVSALLAWLHFESPLILTNIFIVTMEAVTRIMDAENPSWYHELSAFFQAVTQVMFLEYNESCGCHIHMSSWNGKFSLSQLKKIAYAVVVFEKHVFEILPESRRRNKYCKPNTTESSQLQAIFKNGRNRDSFEELADRLDDDVNSLADLKALMHDARSDSRYVLWNFNNICTTGTVEFRGGPQIRNESWTIAWAVFALAFIKLAISEVCTRKITPKPVQCNPYVLARWWWRLGSTCGTRLLVHHAWRPLIRGESRRTMATHQEMWILDDWLLYAPTIII